MGPRVVPKDGGNGKFAALAPYVLPMRPAAWVQYYNKPSAPLVRGNPLAILPGGGLAEPFPTAALGIRYNYLVAPFGGRSILGYSYLSMTVGLKVLKGSPVFEFLSPTNQCKTGCDPVSARPMIWGINNDLTSTVNRWWAHNAAFVLAPGKATVVVPLDGSQWTGVTGARGDLEGKGAFLASKGKVYGLCITFGGGWFYGHGTDTVGGVAQFQLFDYRLY